MKVIRDNGKAMEKRKKNVDAFKLYPLVVEETEIGAKLSYILHLI
jgi:hypothetical protein